MSFRISILPDEDAIEAEGIKYSFDFFRNLGVDGIPDGTYFQIVKREDGMITVTRFEPASEKRS